MFLLSAGKTTVLSYYDDLEPRAIYEHANVEGVDFQFYSQQQVFVEVNKKSGLEILRIKERLDHGLEIQRVQKLTIENVYCVACAKNSLEEMALGLSNGHMKIYNYKNSEFVHRFSTENNRNSVCFSDYNASDEYIASVFENGHISTYGIKTKTKVDTFKIDGLSTLARFHPLKRLQLAIASFKGAVTLYDVQTKKKLFHSSDSHAAPCRDLSMCVTNSEILISVGYDCTINVFDTRRKTPSIQINYCHPLSAVTLSACGVFFCVGNLKGELALYDIRNTKNFLRTKKLHENAVTRVAFVPNFVHKGENIASSTPTAGKRSISPTICQQPMEIPEPIQKTTVSRYRDSFCDGLEMKINNIQDSLKVPRNSFRRDSFDWEALDTRNLYDNPKLEVVDENSSGMMFDFQKPIPALRAEAPASNTSVFTSPVKLDKSINKTIENASIDQEQHQVIENINFDKTKNKLDTNKDSSQTTAVKCETNPANGFVSDSHTKAIAELRREMNERFQELENEVKLNSEKNKWQLLTQNANFWNKQDNTNEQIFDALALIMRTDPFIAEFLRLKNENEALKAQLIQKKINE